MERKTVYKILIIFTLILFLWFSINYTFLERNITLAIGSISISIAILSIFLGYCSELRMEKITRASYNSLYHEFNLRRLELRRRLIGYGTLVVSNANPNLIQNSRDDYLVYHSFSIWVCKRYIKSMIDFGENLLDDFKREILHELDNYFIDLSEGKDILNIQITDNYKNQLQSIIDSVSEFNVFLEDEQQIQRLLVNLLYLKDEGPITYQEY